jgi:hypothetical protein
MNRRYSPSSEAAHLVAEVSSLSDEQCLEIYGIEIDRLLLKNKKGLIYDTTYDKYFKTVPEWAAFCVAQDRDDYEDEDEYSGKWGDDE